MRQYAIENKESIAKRMYEYVRKPEVLEHKKNYDKIYAIENKESIAKRMYEYVRKPEVLERTKQYNKEYYTRPEVIKHRYEYRRMPNVIEQTKYRNAKYRIERHNNILQNYENKEELGVPTICYVLLFKNIENNESFIKIGITSYSIKDRYYNCNNGTGKYKKYRYEVLYSKNFSNRRGAMLLEYKLLHLTNNNKYDIDKEFIGFSECRNINTIEYIHNYFRGL